MEIDKKTSPLLMRCLYSILDGTFFFKIQKIKEKDEISSALAELFFSIPGIVSFLSFFIRTKQNRIVTISFFPDNTNNIKAVLEYFGEYLAENFEIYAISKKGEKSHFHKRIKLIRHNRNSILSLLFVMSAKYVIFDVECPIFFPKKKNQVFINTYHGSFGFKKLLAGPMDKKTQDLQNSFYQKQASHSGRITDFGISNSDLMTDALKIFFSDRTTVLMIGNPRNDILFSEDFIVRNKKKVHDFFHISDDLKICLYAPTYRANLNKDSHNLDFSLLSKSLSNHFGGKWLILRRYHPALFSKSGEMLQPDSESVNATDYPDIQELICAADIGISDYSSWLLDYILTRKPAFIYAPDLDAYSTERGWHLHPKDTPIPLAENNLQLAEIISKFNLDEYVCNINDFLKKIDCKENGTACKQLMQIVEDGYRCKND